MGVGGQHHAPAALPPGKNRYPLYRRLGAPQGRSGRVQKISPPPGFDPRTVQPVASRYTDCAIPAPPQYTKECKNNTVTTSLMLNNVNRWQILPHNEHMSILCVTTQPQQETVGISICCKIRLKTTGLMPTWSNVKQAVWFDFCMWRVSTGVNSLWVSRSVQSMRNVMDTSVDMVQCFQQWQVRCGWKALTTGQAHPLQMTMCILLIWDGRKIMLTSPEP